MLEALKKEVFEQKILFDGFLLDGMEQQEEEGK